MKTEAVILAGGFGTRLKGVVDNIPKPMAIIAGKPFLTYLLEQLNDAEFTKAVLAVGYRHEAIIDYFGKRYKSVELDYSIEDKPLGTGGAILNAAGSISSPGFLVLNGDSIFKIDLADFEKKFNEKEAPVSIALKRMKDFDRYGTVEVEGNRVKKFSEKKYCKEGLINSGIYMISKDWFIRHSPVGKFSFEKEILEKFCSESVITGYEYEGYFIDIGIPEDYAKANLDLKSFTTE